MTRFKFYGLCSFEIITSQDQHILVDPSFEGNRAIAVTTSEVDRVDLIVLSSAASLVETEKLAMRTGAPVVCGPEIKSALVAKGISHNQVRGMTWGSIVEIAGMQVQALECHQPTRFELADEKVVNGWANAWLLLADKGVRFFYSGRTTLFSDLKLVADQNKPNIGAIPISIPEETPGEEPGRLLTQGMTPQEAALAAQWLGLEVVLPCGYINSNCSEIQQFNKSLTAAAQHGAKAPESVGMNPGEVFKFNPK